MTETIAPTNKAQYGRVKGAEWFPFLYKKDIMVLGQGGIGSWTALLLARIGCTLSLWDHDFYEEHNMTGQLVRKKDIGKNKSEVAGSIIEDFSPDCEYETNGKYKADSESNHIVICGFDNMEARSIAFKNWKHFVMTLPSSERKQCFFQDGRLNSEYLQIFNIPGDDAARIEQYEKEQLFTDAEVAEADCTFKQTSHVAAMIAGFMVSFLTNWATNTLTGKKGRQVPYRHAYFVPANMLA